MTTTNVRYWHEYYAEMPACDRQLIDSAYAAAIKDLKYSGLTCANDDRAEALVAAITRYVVESRS